AKSRTQPLHKGLQRDEGETEDALSLATKWNSYPSQNWFT
ncbi:unnamed protein product, partial [marine sediment metagenome]